MESRTRQRSGADDPRGRRAHEAGAPVRSARHSQGPEEWIVREFFNDMKSGVFLDVGAYRAVEWSNTAALEQDLNWSGVAIDANEEFGAEYSGNVQGPGS